MAVTKIKPIKSTLSKALDYIQNPAKTEEKLLVSSFGCSYETADIEFAYTLSQALEKGNNLAHHLMQSFEPGEVSYEKAHEIGRQLADAVTKGQHEYVLTTHIDKGHIHNHVIFCAVNFIDHRKYNSNKRSYYGIRNISDRLCRENGLSVVVPGRGSKGKSYAEYQADRAGTSWKGKLKIAVDTLIPQASDFTDFLRLLQAAGYEIKPGKYIALFGEASSVIDSGVAPVFLIHEILFCFFGQLQFVQLVDKVIAVIFFALDGGIKPIAIKVLCKVD